ncbi:MAG: hypothetical protein ABUS79_15345, partial [Pseudomonadota bacterium]
AAVPMAFEAVPTEPQVDFVHRRHAVGQRMGIVIAGATAAVVALALGTWTAQSGNAAPSTGQDQSSVPARDGVRDGVRDGKTARTGMTAVVVPTTPAEAPPALEQPSPPDPSGSSPSDSSGSSAPAAPQAGSPGPVGGPFPGEQRRSPLAALKKARQVGNKVTASNSRQRKIHGANRANRSKGATKGATTKGATTKGATTKGATTIARLPGRTQAGQAAPSFAAPAVGRTQDATRPSADPDATLPFTD